MGWLGELQIIGEVALAIFLGGIIGFEREAANKPAGFRTHMLVAGAAQFCIGCTRLVLKVLLFLGHGLSCFLLRQMEYDADSYEIKVAGSAAAERTMRRHAEAKAELGTAEERWLELEDRREALERDAKAR